MEEIDGILCIENGRGSTYVCDAVRLLNKLNSGSTLREAAYDVFGNPKDPPDLIERELLSPMFMEMSYFKDEGSLKKGGLVDETYTYAEYSEHVQSAMNSHDRSR